MNEIGTDIAPNEITPLIDFIVTALVPLRKTYTMLNIHGYFHLKQAINTAKQSQRVKLGERKSHSSRSVGG